LNPIGDDAGWSQFETHMKIGKKGQSKVEMLMTPMIDIVFQLLTFFIMSFKIAAQEGDFNIKMPLASPREGMPNENDVPLKVKLTASPGGALSGITMGDRRFENYGQLQQAIISMVGKDTGPGKASTQEVELDCDYNLRYEEVVNAVTAVSGYATRDGQIVKLIEKLKFAPRHAEGK